MNLIKYIDNIPLGYSEGHYKKEKYGISKTIFNKGKSIKIYAKQLGGKNFISLNYYITKNDELVKPCEMSQQKVIHFLNNVKLN